MKKLKETKKHVERDAPRILQTQELGQIDGGGGRLIPPGAIIGVQWS